MSNMTVNYVPIDACKCNFTLFWRRSKDSKSVLCVAHQDGSMMTRKFLGKVLRCFPTKPKLKDYLCS